MENDIRLEDVGWKVLRQRQVNLEKLLMQAIRAAAAEFGAVRLIDLAVGTGRLVLSTLRSMPEQDITAVLQDTDPTHLDQGRQLANQLGVTRVRFQLGDAFDERELGRMAPPPNVVLAAGLYELTPDDTKVLASLRGAAAGMAPGGWLIYTDQPHHDHLEMIGRVAVPREESPWAMHRRSVEEMDALIETAGLSRLERETDEYGLFCVGLARRATTS